jgi:hypothetical protein
LLADLYERSLNACSISKSTDRAVRQRERA